MKRASATRILSEMFPARKISIVGYRRTFHSTIVVFTMERENGAERETLVAKQNASRNEDEVEHEYEEQLKFYQATCDKIISAPEPISVNSRLRIIVMRHVEGSSLKTILLKFFPVDETTQSNAMRLSARALASYHRSSLEKSENGISISSPYLDPNPDTSELADILPRLSLGYQVKPFLDFSPSNVMLQDLGGQAVLRLIDFPHVRLFSIPHLDLARFRFSLRVIKEHPRFRITRISRWEVDDLFGIFLEEYQTCLRRQSCNEDRQLINWLEREYARHLDKEYARLQSTLMIALERLYMKRLISEIEKRDWRLA